MYGKFPYWCMLTYLRILVRRELVGVMHLLKTTYDGDEFSGTLTLDKNWAKYSRRLRPHTGLMDMNRPLEVSRMITLPVPMLSTLNNWLAYEKKEMVSG